MNIATEPKLSGKPIDDKPRKRTRPVLWFTIVIIVAFAFATQLGSVATFAGLLTAGVAVALQNVILSVAGYFLLIGRFGIRVGDRRRARGRQRQFPRQRFMAPERRDSSGGCAASPDTARANVR